LRDLNIAVMVSGSGSNLEAIFQAAQEGNLPGANVVLVVSSRRDAYALERARKYGVKSTVIDPRDFPDDASFQEAIVGALARARIDVICLAGYLRKLGKKLIHQFQGRILNIHPALLPKFGGPGMYGRRVHEAVLAAGEKESGCSVHIVDEEFDQGPVLAQERVPVLLGDTPERLAERVLEQEHRLYPRVLREFCESLRGSLTKDASL
jgi:phosphoribosylglycinamide formyltransferase-1